MTNDNFVNTTLIVDASTTLYAVFGSLSDTHELTMRLKNLFLIVYRSDETLHFYEKPYEKHST